MARRGERPIQKKMVGWYDPGQLLHTAVQVVVSGLLGTRADFRVLESLAVTQVTFDFGSEKEIWIDYVADLGDGWDSTYTIASLLGAESLEVSLPSGMGGKFQTHRGRLLVMGGDEVYPVASRQRYLERTVGPYEYALPETNSPHPNLFAIPGNHDWYDGLVSFSRLFCQERWIGGWKTRQKRSYFAIRLPHRWWIWGVDIQLESDIDQPQLEYFRDVAEKMQEGDRVILVTAEPHWIYGNIYDPKFQSNLGFLEKNVIRAARGTVQVFLAGDLHHYRRHEAGDGSQVQLITSGGGGAFLHPTYGPPVSEIRMDTSPGVVYRLKSEFPNQSISKQLLRRDLLFLLLNPKFGLLTGLLYALFGSQVGPFLRDSLLRIPFSAGNLFKAVGLSLKVALGTLPGIVWIVLVIGGFISFTDTHKKLYRFIAGSLHGVSNLLALAFIGWLIVRLSRHGSFDLSQGPLPAQWAIVASLFVGGSLTGSCLMGLYLYISLRFFRRHSNEAFSALHIPDYKNFLRLHIDQQGGLTIYPIGVEKVPRRWEQPTSYSPGDPMRVPAGGVKIPAGLIEPAIRIRPRNRGSTV